MYSATDALELVLAVLAYALLVILPGFAIASLTSALGWRSADKLDRCLLALVVGLAALPALLSLTLRLLGLGAGIALELGLVAAGLALVVRGRAWPRLRGWWLAPLAAWLAIIVFEYIDFDAGGGLHQSLIVYDIVKHAATIRALDSSGAPPIDAFFFRPERSGYYYFFYTLPAILARMSGGLIDARAAFGGLAFWTAPGLFGLACFLLEGAGLVNDDNRVRVRWTVLALLACTGLAILGVVGPGFHAGQWLQDVDLWNEQVTTWVNSLLWVPHHVTALIAAWVALAALAGEAGRDQLDPRRWLAAAGLAAVCFATAFGASVWVTIIAAFTVAAWSVSLLIAGRFRVLAWIVAAGALALVIDGPAILDLMRNRHDTGLPVALTIRAFNVWDSIVPCEPYRSIGRFVLLPVNYGLEFGIFALGAGMFWWRRGSAGRPATELSALLTIGALSGLVICTFLTSTVISNDLGWRGMLFPQLVCLIWTAVALDDASRRPASAPRSAWITRLPLSAGLLLVLGYIGVAYTLVCARLPSAWFETAGRFINAAPAVDHDLRKAYEWANVHLPPNQVLQHNPAPQRVFDFGLYSRNRVGVSDLETTLYGAPRDQAFARLNVFVGVFGRALPVDEVRGDAAAAGVNGLVVTASDPGVVRQIFLGVDVAAKI